MLQDGGACAEISMRSYTGDSSTQHLEIYKVFQLSTEVEGWIQ